uniref:Putative ixodegrin protein n=1 Tax=Ixodes ricinus TaxID=34613 RepID=A0A0K8RM89_IXORI
MGTLCAALALTFVLATLLEKNIAYDDMGQYPVLPDGPKRKPPGKLGDWCAPYRLCGPGLCCLKFRNGSKICQPEAKLGEACSDAPIKGQIYPRHCPCLTGMCVQKRCVVSTWE